MLESVLQVLYKLNAVTVSRFIYLDDNTIVNANDISLVQQCSGDEDYDTVILKSGMSVKFIASDKGVDHFMYEIEEALRVESIPNALKDLG